MYLSATDYVSGYNHQAAEEQSRYRAVIEAIGLGDFRCEYAPSVSVSVTIGYWRKANAIHRWFVSNVQGGKDECQRSCVEREQLIELRDLCRKALETRDASLLPPCGGFFFGSTEIDEYYWEGVKDTDKQLTAILEDKRFESYDFEYRSSW